MLRDWGWGVHDPSRRQGLDRAPVGDIALILPFLFKSCWSWSMFYDDCCMDAGKGLGVCVSSKSVAKAGTFRGIGIGPQWGITHSSPPLLLEIWGEMFPVVDYAIIPPSPLLYLLVKIKYIKYSMFMFWIPLCPLATPSIHVAVILLSSFCVFFSIF